MKSNKRTIYYIAYIVIVAIILIIDISFKIFDNTTRKYLSFLTGFLFILIVIIEARKNRSK
jgi:hypothetical protein